MKVGSLFCGAGGFDLGFINAGHEILWALDFDKDCIDTYKKNIGDHAFLADIKEVDFKQLEDIDLIIGGFPCQGFSIANQHRHVDDGRNSLYYEFVRAIDEKKPKYFLAENVRGILSLDKGEAIKQIVKDFENTGYDVEYKLLNASNFSVPQNRLRVFIWGIRKDIYHSNMRVWPKETTENNKISIGTALKGIPEPDQTHNLLNHIGSKYKVTNRNFTGCRTTDPDKPCPTIIARGNGKGGVNAIQHPKNHRRMTIREQAIIQTFPMDFEFCGSMTSCYRQIGNAVPIILATEVAKSFKLIENIPPSNSLKIISLFTGAGGFDLGMIQAGHKVVWANDILPDAVETYKNNIGSHVICGDITKINADDIPDGDIVIGGFPCQGFSIANMNRKRDDSRNTLYLEFLRILKEKKPKYFIAENVRGILSLDKGEVFERIIKDFTECGYKVNYQILNASDFGVPQNRYRVFIFGYRNDIPMSIPFTFQPTHGKNLLPKITIGEALKNIPEPEDEHTLKNHVYSKFKLKKNGYINHREVDPNKPAPTVTARGDGKGGAMINHHPNNHRRLSVRETATIQTFPIDFEFCGSMTMSYLQVGNAVPPMIGKMLGDFLQRVVENDLDNNTEKSKHQQELFSQPESLLHY